MSALHWRPMRTASRKRGTRIIALGRMRWPERSPEMVAECMLWRIGRAIGWCASNKGYGFTVGFIPRRWIPVPLVVGKTKA